MGRGQRWELSWLCRQFSTCFLGSGSAGILFVSFVQNMIELWKMWKLLSLYFHWPVQSVTHPGSWFPPYKWPKSLGCLSLQTCSFIEHHQGTFLDWDSLVGGREGDVKGGYGDSAPACTRSAAWAFHIWTEEEFTWLYSYFSFRILMNSKRALKTSRNEWRALYCSTSWLKLLGKPKLARI